MFSACRQTSRKTRCVLTKLVVALTLPLISTEALAREFGLSFNKLQLDEAHHYSLGTLVPTVGVKFRLKSRQSRSKSELSRFSLVLGANRYDDSFQAMSVEQEVGNVMELRRRLDGSRFITAGGETYNISSHSDIEGVYNNRSRTAKRILIGSGVVILVVGAAFAIAIAEGNKRDRSSEG